MGNPKIGKQTTPPSARSASPGPATKFGGNTAPRKPGKGKGK